MKLSLKRNCSSPGASAGGSVPPSAAGVLLLDDELDEELEEKPDEELDDEPPTQLRFTNL